MGQALVAEDRHKRSHCHDWSENSVTYNDFKIVLTVQYLVDFPFSHANKFKLALAFARSVAIAHHEGRRASKRCGSKLRSGVAGH